MDTKTDTGNYLLNMSLANAELFLDQMKSGWKSSKARAVARGAHIGPTPIGYSRVPKGKPGSGTLVPHPTYGPAITDLFKRAAKGTDGDSALARWFTERAPREGGAVWSPSETRRWLSNRVYLGEVKYAEMVNPDAHKPLTTPRTWERCQRAPGVQVRSNRKFMLAGLVRCSHCRYAMSGQAHGGRNGAIPVYRCSSGKGKGCDESSVIKVDGLDRYVRELALEHVRGLELEAVAEGTDLAALDEAYDAAEAELRTFATDLDARRLLGDAGWQEALTARALDRDAKGEARKAAYAASQIAVATRRNVDDLSDDDLRDLLQGLVRTIFVRRRPRGANVDDRALVIWSDDPRDIEVPGPHRSGPFEPIRW